MLQNAMKTGNLYRDLPQEMPEELVEILAIGEGRVRIERLVSRGHASSPGFWYEQAGHEWVVLLSGSARLRFERPEGCLDLLPGDWVEIPPRRRHRVEATDGALDSVWLAVHWESLDRSALMT